MLSEFRFTMLGDAEPEVERPKSVLFFLGPASLQPTSFAPFLAELEYRALVQAEVPTEK